MPNTAARPSFSIVDANRTLPLVRSIASDVVTEFARMKEASRERRALEVESSVGAPTEGEGATPAAAAGAAGAESSRRRLDELKGEVNERSARIDGYIHELEELGVEVRDLERGQIEFPSDRHGRPVWLCWQVGEPAVAQWRGENETFADRRPVPVAEIGPGHGPRSEGKSSS